MTGKKIAAANAAAAAAQSSADAADSSASSGTGTGVLGFLTQGAPVAAPTGSDTSSSFPLWLQQALYGTIGAASNLAAQPYTPYPGPTVAAPSAATTQAQTLAESNVGNYNPYLQQAGALTSAAAAPITSSDISNYLNPYQGYLTQQLDQNLTQNVLPSVSSQFVSAGQAASPQQAEIDNQAVRSTQNAVGTSLANSYQGALTSLQNSRQQEQQAGAQFGALGQEQFQLGAGDVGQLAASGQAQDINNQNNLNAGINQFNTQQQYPYNNLSYLSSIIRGLPTNQAGSTTQTAGTTYLPSNYYSPSALATGLGTAASASALGLKRGGAVRKSRGALSSLKAA